MLEFTQIDDETIHALDDGRSLPESPMAVLCFYEEWVLDCESVFSILTADDCRLIAQKLEELNG